MYNLLRASVLLHSWNGILAPIAILAVEDESITIRAWFARNSKILNYPSENLEDRLRTDPVPLVRAGVFENPAVSFCRSRFSSDGCESIFLDANYLERLALVRNPEVSHELMKLIFDTDDSRFGLDLRQRADLVDAFVTST